MTSTAIRMRVVSVELRPSDLAMVTLSRVKRWERDQPMSGGMVLEVAASDLPRFIPGSMVDVALSLRPEGA